MKVCVMTSAHPPDDARIYYKEICSLRKCGYEVTLIAPRPPKTVASEITAEGVVLRYAPSFENRRERWAGLKEIERLAAAEAADIYHFHDPDLLSVALRLRKKLKKPVIYDIHEYYADSLRTRYWLPSLVRGTVAGVFDFYEKNAAKKMSALITVNEHMATLFRTVNPEGAVLYNYPLQAQFSYPSPARSAEGRGQLILYLGGISQERGLEVILEAMLLVREQFPGAYCQMAGPLDEGGLSAKYRPLEPWFEKCGVQFLGKLPYEQVPSLLRKGSIALVPLLETLNYQKAIPVKLLEYMAAGLPVVGSDFGYMREIIAGNSCGFLAKPGDFRDVAAQICRLLAHPEEAAACARRGWEAFHAKYCWEKEEPKLWALYERLLKEG